MPGVSLARTIQNIIQHISVRGSRAFKGQRAALSAFFFSLSLHATKPRFWAIRRPPRPPDSSFKSLHSNESRLLRRCGAGPPGTADRTAIALASPALPSSSCQHGRLAHDQPASGGGARRGDSPHPLTLLPTLKHSRVEH